MTVEEKAKSSQKRCRTIEIAECLLSANQPVGCYVDDIKTVSAFKEHFFVLKGEHSVEHKLASALLNILMVIELSIEKRNEDEDKYIEEWIGSDALRAQLKINIEKVLGSYNANLCK